MVCVYNGSDVKKPIKMWIEINKTDLVDVIKQLKPLAVIKG